MRTRIFLPSAIALVLAGVGFVHAQTAVTSLEVEALIIDQGYTAPYDIELRHGLWRAEATSLDGHRVDVVIDPANGAVIAVDAASGNGLSYAQVQQALTRAGYRRIDDLEFDDGIWEAEAINAAGIRVDLAIHPLTGAVLSETQDGHPIHSAGLLNAAQINSMLTAAGYRNVRDLDFDDGYWEADATNPAGQRVELTIDPRTGAVVREERD